MKKSSVYSGFIIVLLLTCTDRSYAFSWRSLCHAFVINLSKGIAARYLRHYFESHGYDSDSQRQQARCSGTCHIPWPAYVKGEVPIAPETVPNSIQERIEALKQGNYDWPTCRPLLLTGPAGFGKTQLAKYVAKESGCPFMYLSAAGFMSSKENSGVETVASLFKRSRVRPELSAWALRFRQLWAFICRRPIARKEPTIVFIDEFDAISKPAGNDVVNGDAALETERDKIFARLCWEMSHSPYTKDFLRAPRCPPADIDECFLRWCSRNKRQSLDESFAENRRKWRAWWEIVLFKQKSETLVIAATNSEPDKLCPEVNDWFGRLEIQAFDRAQRKAVLQFHAQGKHVENDQIIERLSEQSGGYSPARLASLLNDAALSAALRDGVIQQVDIDRAIALSERY